MRIQGGIFDLDGTLLDSMFIWDGVGEAYLRSRGLTPEPGLNEKFKVMSILQAAEYYRSHYGITDSVETIIAGVNGRITHLYTDEVGLKPGVAQLLHRLREKGVALCVATATDRHLVEAALRRTGIFDCFQAIFTCTEVGFGKDSPVIFQRALDYLGTEQSQTFVFEDAPHAIETAKAAGFPVVGVYDASAEGEQEKLQALCDYYVNSFEDWSEEIQ
ncbi:MAG: HAD family phosphatase [Oscillospiraceae bacterium]